MNNPLFARLVEIALSRGWRKYKEDSVVAELNCAGDDIDPAYRGLKLTLLSEHAISLEIHNDTDHLWTTTWLLNVLQRHYAVAATGKKLSVIQFVSLDKLEADIVNEIKTVY